MSDIKFNQDERAINDLISKNPNAFNQSDALAVIDARSAIEELMFKARVESAAKYGIINDKNRIIELISKELKATES